MIFSSLAKVTVKHMEKTQCNEPQYNEILITITNTIYQKSQKCSILQYNKDMSSHDKTDPTLQTLTLLTYLQIHYILIVSY